jgi:uncharacterized glyoxalase superfamily protein PhnB
MVHATSIRPFVPAKDYRQSREFYTAIGFNETWTSPDLSVMTLDSCTFYLQNFFHQTFADHFMLTLMVDDVDGWWAQLQALDLLNRFPGTRLKAPADQPWGMREIHLADPTNVCWHIAMPIKAKG